MKLHTRGIIEAEEVGERVDVGPERFIAKFPSSLSFNEIRDDGTTAHSFFRLIIL